MFIPGRLYEFIGPLEPPAQRLDPLDQCRLYHISGGLASSAMPVYLHAHSDWVFLSLGPYHGVNCFGWEKLLGPDGNQYALCPTREHWKETGLHSSRAGDVER